MTEREHRETFSQRKLRTALEALEKAQRWGADPDLDRYELEAVTECVRRALARGAAAGGGVDALR